MSELVKEAEKLINKWKTRGVDLTKYAEIYHKLFCHCHYIPECAWEYECWEPLGITKAEAVKDVVKFLENGGHKEDLDLLLRLKYKTL